MRVRPPGFRRPADRLLTLVDLAATLLYSVEGAAAAVMANVDAFGLVVMAFVAALGGGVMRDLIVGEHPPAAFRSKRYALVALTGAAIVFAIYESVQRIPAWALNGLEAAGLGMFCVAGAAKALDYGMNAVAAVLLGITTACAGGAIHDILLNRIPFVLTGYIDAPGHIYAVAAGCGAAVMVLMVKLGASRRLAMAAGFAVCVLLRLISIWQDWNLPQVAH